MTNKYKCDLDPKKLSKNRCNPSAEGTTLEECQRTCFTEDEKRVMEKIIKPKLPAIREETKQIRASQMKRVKKFVRKGKIRDVDKILGNELLNKARDIIREDAKIYNEVSNYEEEKDTILDIIRSCWPYALENITSSYLNVCVLNVLDLTIKGLDFSLRYSVILDYAYMRRRKKILKLAMEKVDLIPLQVGSLEDWVKKTNKFFEEHKYDPEKDDISFVADRMILDKYNFLLERKLAKLEALKEVLKFSKQIVDTKCSKRQQQMYNLILEKNDNTELIPKIEHIFETTPLMSDRFLEDLLHLKIASMNQHVKECTDLGQIVIIPMSLDLHYYDGTTGAHANMLVIRDIDGEKQIIRIEPHGYKTSLYDKQWFSKFMHKLFEPLIDDGYVYLDNVLDVFGPQLYAQGSLCPIGQKEEYQKNDYFPGKGLCTIWSTYIILVFLLSVDVPDDIIGDYLSFRNITNMKERTIVFTKKALATYLLLLWSFVRHLPQVSQVSEESRKGEQCLTDGIQTYHKYKSYIDKLNPIFDEMDKIVPNYNWKGQIEGGGNYYQKYMKYKMKYLNLKKQMNL